MSDTNSTQTENLGGQLDKREAEPGQSYQDSNDTAPDGGTTAWLVVLGGWCVAFCSFGWVNSVGVFQEYYQTGPLSNYSPSIISWIPSLQIFFMMGMGPIVGTIYDKYGPRYLLFFGSFFHVFGLMMASISDQYYQLLLSQGVCSAIGVSAIFHPAINCVPGWFTTRRGAAYGILATGSSIGGVVFPIMVSRLVGSIGYGWAMRVSSFLILGLLVVANLTVRSRQPPRPTPVTAQQLIQPFREVLFFGLILGMFLLSFGIYIPITYIQVQALDAGMQPELAEYLVTMLNAGSLFGRIGSGIAGDKIGRFNSFILSCFCSGIVTLALWIPGASNGAIIAYTVLFGFFSGAYVSLIGALVAQISPPHEIGFRTGLVFLVGSLPGLVTGPIAGAIVDRTGEFNGLKIFAGTMLILGTCCVMISRVHGAGWKWSAVF